MNFDSKKTEKLVSALYLLTSFFDAKEPMKWRLRELGSQLISATSESRNIVLEIVSLLTVGKNAGLISDMNFEIIHREFSLLLPPLLTIGDIFAAAPLTREVVVPQKTSEESAPIIAPEKSTLYVASSVAPLQRAPIIKDKTYTPVDTEKPRPAYGQGKTLKEFGAVAVKKNSRQSVIISLLKRKKEIMIKDVSPLIDGVSEKTIQRELLAMVAQKILRKEGEKRWSRYSLAE